MAKIGRPKLEKNIGVDYTAYPFRIPKQEKKKLQEKINKLAAAEDLQVWQVISRAVENYRLKGEKR